MWNKKPRTLPRDPRGRPNTLLIYTDFDTDSMIPSDLSQIDDTGNIVDVSIRGPLRLWKDEFDFSIFQDFSNLKHIEVIGATVEHVDLSPLSACKSLETLYIEDCHKKTKFTLFSNPSLRTLAITDCNSHWEWDFSPVADCTSLEWVYLAKNCFDHTVDLTWLDAFKVLPYVNLQSSCLSSLNLGWLLDKVGFEEMYEKIFVSDIDGGDVVLLRDDDRPTDYAWDERGILYSLRN